LEGIVLSGIGGLVGFIIGTALARIAIPMLSNTVFNLSWRLDILGTSILLSLVIGTIASVYPAQQAANLDPAEALRFI